jgi:hypothetical protein
MGQKFRNTRFINNVIRSLKKERKSVLRNQTVYPGSEFYHPGSASKRRIQIRTKMSRIRNTGDNIRLRLAVLSSDLLRSCCVAASRSEPNCAKAATSRYWASSSFMLPATCFMDLVWAADPTRDTDRPTLIAGRIPGVTT